jgi:hypothetical protein
MGIQSEQAGKQQPGLLLGLRRIMTKDRIVRLNFLSWPRSASPEPRQLSPRLSCAVSVASQCSI